MYAYATWSLLGFQFDFVNAVGKDKLLKIKKVHGGITEEHGIDTISFQEGSPTIMFYSMQGKEIPKTAFKGKADAVTGMVSLELPIQFVVQY